MLVLEGKLREYRRVRDGRVLYIDDVKELSERVVPLVTPYNGEYLVSTVNRTCYKGQIAGQWQSLSMLLSLWHSSMHCQGSHLGVASTPRSTLSSVTQLLLMQPHLLALIQLLVMLPYHPVQTLS